MGDVVERRRTSPALPRAMLLLALLALACATAACGIVTPASGPPTYGGGRGGDSRA